MIHLYPNPYRGEVIEHPLPDSLGSIPPHPGFTPQIHAALTPAPQELSMSTAAVTLNPAAPHSPNGFERFIDKFALFARKAAPVVIEGASLLKPVLALSPLGPEYNIVVTGIEEAEMASQRVQASGGAALTGTQKFGVALAIGSSSLEQILATKGITEPPAIQAAIAKFTQDVFNLHTGPAAVTPPVIPGGLPLPANQAG